LVELKDRKLRSHAHAKRLELPDLKAQSKCKSIVWENIDNVKEGGALTAPLAFLNSHCEFRKVWDMLNVSEMEREWQAKKEYREKQREKRKATWKKYSKEYLKEYRQRPEVKARMREYYQKNKAKALASFKAYYLKNRVRIIKQQLEYQKRKAREVKQNG
jgi:hypothetical protein